MQTIELTTEQMAYGGAALARYEGKVIFVPYALPNERVRVRVTFTNKRWVKAELLDVLEASPERIEPLCSHFGPQRCGGCHWQHIQYEAQLRYKYEIVCEQLQRIGRIKEPPVKPCLGMDEPWHYRNHVQLHHHHDGVGFVRADKKGIYAIDSCEIMNQAIYPLFELVKEDYNDSFKRLILRGSEETKEQLVIFEGKNVNRISSLLPKNCNIVKREKNGRVRSIRGDVAYHEEVNGQQWRVHANSFFQVNTGQAEQLLSVVKELLPPLSGNELLVDCYAGVGLFGLSLIEMVQKVYLIESQSSAVADANRHTDQTEDVTVIRGKAEDVLSNWSKYGPSPDILLLDPPRAGCKEVILHQLGEMKIPTIIYISCDPTTQARDINHLITLGYVLDVVQPIDLFPHTYHIESVARLRYFIE